MYMGETLEAMPMAVPPVMRHTTNQVKAGAHPVSTLETAKRNAERMSTFLRPQRSLSRPEAMEPARQPSRAQLLAQPMAFWLVRWK